MLLVAEVKTESPFGFKSERSWDELFEIACEHGDIVAIHTDPRWGGSFDLLAKARNRTDKPILAKGIHETNEEINLAIAIGAEHVLVVELSINSRTTSPDGWSWPLPPECWFEPLTATRVMSMAHSSNSNLADVKIVWNDRDLSNGDPKWINANKIRSIWPGWLCQASFIKTPEDIALGVDAVLVGTHLPEFVKTWRPNE